MERGEAGPFEDHVGRSMRNVNTWTAGIAHHHPFGARSRAHTNTRPGDRRVDSRVPQANPGRSSRPLRCNRRRMVVGHLIVVRHGSSELHFAVVVDRLPGLPGRLGVNDLGGRLVVVRSPEHADAAVETDAGASSKALFCPSCRIPSNSTNN